MTSELSMLTNNIRFLMDIHGITTVKDLAKRIKMHQPTLHRTLTGEVKEPKYSTLKQLADFFGVSPIDLVECDLTSSESTAIVETEGDHHSHTFTNVPIRNDIIIGDVEKSAPPPPKNQHSMYIRWASYDKDVYAVRCIGTSMMPRIKQGEFVVIEPNHILAPGDEVLIVTTDNTAFIKTFLFERDGYYHLLPVNEDQAPALIPKNTIEIMHYVAGIAKLTALIR
ncbi:S24 family peptidase [Xenorhabdus sp. SF857]|uniref:S24 family peptidase n=1 Tax=Xenorhabdus bakwenae TaxID=3026967 RepID=UPI00255824A1|nr:S24 family peptidase [Xenorhabdus sp. SF857]WFQ80489.1 S24 family peptidase [Xenorhabdus sp. SF857]